MIEDLGHGHEAEAETKAEKAAHVGHVARQRDGQVPLDRLNVRISDGYADPIILTFLLSSLAFL